MLRRILVPLDGSSFAEGALPVAITIAQKTGGELHLFSVLETVADAAPAHALAERARTQQYLESLAGRLRGVWSGPTHISVREGSVVREIGALALEWGGDLLVMSTHGRSGLSRLWIGSIAERCVRSGFCPTILVRPSETESLDLSQVRIPDRIVLPLDGSEPAERSIPFGVRLCEAFSASLLLMRVLNQPRAMELTHNQEALDIVRRSRAEDRAAAREYLHSQQVRLRGDGVQAFSVLLSELGPAEAIVSRDEGDWVVITASGAGGLERAFFGSVADKVVRSCKHPLLVIPPDRSAQRSAGSGAGTHLAAGD
jgi:nucleotide-binding universal stress UspA family protein